MTHLLFQIVHLKLWSKMHVWPFLADTVAPTQAIVISGAYMTFAVECQLQIRGTNYSNNERCHCYSRYPGILFKMLFLKQTKWYYYQWRRVGAERLFACAIGLFSSLIINKTPSQLRSVHNSPIVGRNSEVFFRDFFSLTLGFLI